MPVPFDAIGPGQSARLVWQVMGKTGPIFNPKGIRYLPADGALGESLVSSSGTLMQAATALAGVNLLVSAGTLALSAATLAEVKKISAKVDRLMEGQIHLGRQLDEVLSRLNRIESKVSEARLATLVAHACKSAACGDDEVSFTPFTALAVDLLSFRRDAGIIRGVPSDMRLGSDVRASLGLVFRLLRGVRLHVAATFNRQVGPESAWRCDPIDDYWSLDRRVAVVSERSAEKDKIEAWRIGSWRAHHAISECFAFAGAADHVALQDGLNGSVRYGWSRFGVSEGEIESRLAACYASANVAAGTQGDDSRWLKKEFWESYQGEVEREAIRACAEDPGNEFTFPPAVIDAAYVDKESPPAVGLARYCAWWLYQTDAGLLYRAGVECGALEVGYDKMWNLASRDGAPVQALGAKPPRQLSEPGVVVVDLRAAVAEVGG